MTRIAWAPFLRLSLIKNTIHRMFVIYVPSVVDPGSAFILLARSGSGYIWTNIAHKKRKKSLGIYCFEVQDVLEGTMFRIVRRTLFLIYLVQLLFYGM
jgi:hypothetical protein